MDPYGLRRVISPAGVLPQRADVLDPALPLGEDELSIEVEALNVDAASFRQLEGAVGGDPGRIGDEVLRIVRARGKMHNPVTGSGGMLIGRVRALGPRHPAAAALRPGDRIATLVSLTLTPLRIDGIRAVRTEIDRVECDGEAILFATGLWARLPDDLPETLALAALDVCGAPALVARHVRPGIRVLVLGAGKSGALVAVQARASMGDDGAVVLADRSEPALDALGALGVADARLRVDATDPLAVLAAAEGAGGRFDLVVNCASVPGTEMAAILAAKDGGTVIFFSMATSFTAAALGAEGVGKDVTMLVGNGYAPGHAELTLDLLRRHPRLRALFEQRYAR
ncbi:L-erythro-3,5-diaminohexanoate dehydrogenase [Anaeromyxobacter dehalogenans 2CP-1]|uniref:L-erythro-3,5-diaminohexanoate dehydrogenase n=1 Tax=Anaeromyxobacter dehalogenans (strain ATCC BAA-258 / DSM 21875 / 2CP-1) TaxID=455488 RepID=B8JHN3_ANAD2|nr:L-erythro-3,5-diaminohexanoate dehydrogenase [Anaeromyxobacter dehalogenans]ACL66745.1 L-erythro-3,5-diaminohexanoate dehydrogenase [Anaeromyxobacter dehalogenans 2CP-1]